MHIQPRSAEHPLCHACRKQLREVSGRLRGVEAASNRPKCAKSGCEGQALGRNRKFCAEHEPSKTQRVRNQNRTKRLRYKTWDGVPDREIYERDDWMCQLGSWCKHPGVPIDRKAPKTACLAPNIDHIIPFSRGGADVALNKRAAHASCNMGRNNKLSVGERLFMQTHPELMLTDEQIRALPPRLVREAKPPKPPKLWRLCGLNECVNGFLADGNRAYCSADHAVEANRRYQRDLYWIRQGLEPPLKGRPTPKREKAAPKPKRCCGTCGGVLYANNKTGHCQRTPECKQAYGSAYRRVR
jgi:hypothetical protein